MIRLHLYDPTGETHLARLSHATNKEYLSQLNGVGAGMFEISATAPEASLITAQCLVKVDIDNTTVGWWVIEQIEETIVHSSANTIKASGRGLLMLLDKVVVYGLLVLTPPPPGLPVWDLSPRSYASSFGEGWFDVLNTNADLPFDFDFDEDYDSGGNAWPKTVSTEFDVNTTMLEVAQYLAKMGYEWYLDGTPNMLAFVAAGDDLSESVVFIQGRDINNLSKRTVSVDLGNAVMAIQVDTYYQTYLDAGSVSTYGRREVGLDAGPFSVSEGAARANMLLSKLSAPLVTYEVKVNTATWKPFDNYKLGDIIRLKTNMQLIDMRVIGIRISQSDASPINVDLEMDQRVEDFTQRVSRLLAPQLRIANEYEE